MASSLAIVLLPLPLSPTKATISLGADREIDVVDGVQPFPRPERPQAEMHGKPYDFEQRDRRFASV